MGEVLRFTKADVERFLRLVDKLPCGCWYWMGARSRGRSRKWYGTFWLKDQGRVRAHRFAAEAIGGLRPLEPGEHRDHTCVFSMCVNPAHLEIVPQRVNQERKKLRRRA